MATSRSMRRILIPQRDGNDSLAMIENDYSNDCTQVSTTIYTFFTLGSCSRPSERLSIIFVFSPTSRGTCASIGTCAGIHLCRPGHIQGHTMSYGTCARTQICRLGHLL